MSNYIPNKPPEPTLRDYQVIEPAGPRISSERRFLLGLFDGILRAKRYEDTIYAVVISTILTLVTVPFILMHYYPSGRATSVTVTNSSTTVTTTGGGSTVTVVTNNDGKVISYISVGSNAHGKAK